MAQESFRIVGGLKVGNVDVIDVNGNVVSPSLVNQLAQLTDVDLNNLVDDGVLMYNTSLSKWVVTKSFDNHNIDAGQY